MHVQQEREREREREREAHFAVVEHLAAVARPCVKSWQDVVAQLRGDAQAGVPDPPAAFPAKVDHAGANNTIKPVVLAVEGVEMTLQYAKFCTRLAWVRWSGRMSKRRRKGATTHE